VFGWAAAMVAAVLGADGRSACAAELFRLERSTNANVVLYEVNAAPAGALDPAEPLRPVWLMLAEDGRREELTGLERSFAYGVELRRATADVAVVALKAEPRRAVSIRSHHGCFVAMVAIDGREALLRTIFVEVGGGLFPAVRSVELVGSDPETGEELRETLAVRR